MAADDQPRLQEEVWALPLPWPTIAYVVRPVGNGPFPLAIINHGVSLDPVQRSFFPLVEFRDAAMWFARRGYMVVAPSGSIWRSRRRSRRNRIVQRRFLFQGRESAAIPISAMPASPSHKSISGSSNTSNKLKRIVPNDVIVIGQSAGGWASIALSSVNPARR